MEQASRCVKVKYIVTQHVETNAGDFKSIVQSLTGKEDSAAAASARWTGTEAGTAAGSWQLPRPAATVEDEGPEVMMPSMEELLDLLMRD